MPVADPIMAHLEAAFAQMLKHGPKPSTPTTGKRASPLGASVLPLRGSVVGTYPPSSPDNANTPRGEASSTETTR